MKSSSPSPNTASKKMRLKIGAKVSSIVSKNDLDYLLSSRIKTELGLTVPRGIAASKFEEFFESISLSECLESIRIIYEATVDHSKEKRPRGNRIGDDFKRFVNKVFKEEKLPYLMTDDGKVVNSPDQEFEDNRVSSINCLSEPRFNAALVASNHAFEDFHADPPRYKSALRNIFEANEVVFKKITNAKALTAHWIEQHKSKFLSLTTDTTSNTAQEQILESYKAWTTAFHNYRHGQNVSTYDPPTSEFTILALSTGAAFLRWIVSIAKKQSETE